MSERKSTHEWNFTRKTPNSIDKELILGVYQIGTIIAICFNVLQYTINNAEKELSL